MVLSRICCKWVLTAFVFSASSSGVAQTEQGGQSLEQAASDPTASLMNIQVGNWYTESFWNLPDKDANTVSLRSAYPFKWGDTSHIARATVPIVTNSPSGDSGLGDSTVFDLMVFERGWGRMGVGLVGLLPTGGADLGSEKWGLGPAFGIVRAMPKTLFGVFNQNVFTVAGDGKREDVNISILQPIFNHQFGNGWSVGVSESNITYDWENTRWSSLPLGLALIKMTRPAGLHVQWNLQYEYNFADDEVVAKHLYRLTAKFLLPAL